MAVIEKKKEELTESDSKKETVFYRIAPEITRDIDYSTRKVEIEIALPGVKKDDISLKALPTWFKLTAKRGNIEYCANTGFGAEVIPTKTTAEYADGLLKIHANIKNPLDDAKEINFQGGLQKMAETQENLIEKKEKSKTVFRIRPTYESYIDYKNKRIEYEIQLPGVPKGNVSLKLLPDFWTLDATREEETSKANYSLSKYFPYEVDVESVESTYDNGLLKFSARLKSKLDDAVDIHLS